MVVVRVVAYICRGSCYDDSWLWSSLLWLFDDSWLWSRLLLVVVCTMKITYEDCVVVVMVVVNIGEAVDDCRCGRLLWFFDHSWLGSSLLSSGIVYTRNVAIMRIFGCCQGCCLHKGSCYDDQWL